MDTELLNEICKRVQEKLKEAQAKANTTEEERQALPSLLVLTEDHGTICHETLEHTELAGYYCMECAMLTDYQCCMKDYEGVVLYTLSNEALGKVAHGILDNGFTRLLGQALLEGKKIYAAREGIELYRYANTAPKAFYQRLEENLQLLTDSGMVIAPHEHMADLILHGAGEEEKQESKQECSENTCESRECGGSLACEPVKEAVKDPEPELKEAALDKKIITEKDMIALGNQRIKRVLIQEKAILSDLAKEYAKKHKMLIERREISSGKREQRL